MSIQNNAWVRLSKPGQDNLRIFFFPFSGATALAFRPLATLLPPGMIAYAYELPARGSRFLEKAYDNIAAMVQDAANGIQQLLTQHSYFFGHSLGGIIAFEVIRELRRRDSILPKHLFISGAKAPHLPLKEKSCHDLPKDEFINKISELGGTPKELLENPEMLDIIVPILRKDFQAYETYTYKPEDAIQIPITAMGGKSDNLVSKKDISAWSQLTKSAFFTQMFDGDHFFVLSNGTSVLDTMTEKIYLQQKPW